MAQKIYLNKVMTDTSPKVRKVGFTQEEIEQKLKNYQYREMSYREDCQLSGRFYTPPQDVQFDVTQVSDLNDSNRSKLEVLNRRGYSDEMVMHEIRKYDTSVLDVLLGCIH